MATKNMLTDSTKKGRSDYQKRMEIGRKAAQVGHLSSVGGKNEHIARKDPTVAAEKKRSKTAALASKNMSGRYPNSIEYGDEDAHYESQGVRHPKEWKRANFGKNRDLSAANKVASRAVRKSRLANDFAASDLPNIVKKRQTGAKKTVNRGLEAGVAKRVGAMMPKSTGPAKKSTRARKTSK